MKTKMNEMNKKSINSKLISCSALALVLSMAVLVPCQNAVGTVPNTSTIANSSLIKGTETIVNPGLRLAGEEMYGAHKASNSKFSGPSSVQSTTADDCKDLMKQFKAKIKFIESLRGATDEKSIIKRGIAAAEAYQLIQDMIAAGCAVDITKLTHMVAHAVGSGHEEEDEDDVIDDGK